MSAFLMSASFMACFIGSSVLSTKWWVSWWKVSRLMLLRIWRPSDKVASMVALLLAVSASLAPVSMPLTNADIATRLETPRMIPSIVKSVRSLLRIRARMAMRKVISKFMSA